ncbi:MAG: protein kinase domain-containing protein, partial [Persicimonas sp.]
MSQTVTHDTADSIDIPGIEILEEVGRGAHSVVFRGRIEDDNSPCAIKVRLAGSDEEQSSHDMRYRREAAVLARFHHPGLVHIIEVGQTLDSERPYLVMEYVDGPTLAQEIAESAPFEPDQVVAVARTLASALAEVHRHGLIHRDIKPGNVLVRRDDGQVKLVDFGFVARARREERQDQSVVGTLRYSAPEQSGMLQRPVDGRSDLYSLGVVLYECAVGQPPFDAREAGELMHLHAVEEPVSARLQNPEIGSALSAIIDKLLAKDPDDRYASAEALVQDLERLGQLDQRAERGEALELGGSVVPDAQAHAAPIFGREEELEQIVSGWLAARAGDGGVCWLTGVPGCGSSRLAAELVARATEEEAIVLRVDCSQTPDSPFAALRQAGANFVRLIEAFEPETARACRAHIEEASREYMPVLARITSDVFELPEAARRFVAQDTGSPTRYADSIVSFFSGLATREWPVLIVLDEIPLIDEASRQVFEKLARQASSLPLYFVCTAHEEAELADSPEAYLGGVEEVPLTHLRLGPLDQKAVAEMIAQELGGRGLPAAIVRQIAARTQGVPLAIREYLFAMIDAGLLRPVRGGWEVDSEGLDSLDLPSDLTHLMLRRVDELDEDERRVLSAAAVEGRRFHLGRLYEYAEADEVAVSEAISAALHLRLVEYGRSDEYLFVHQRVRAALSGELDEETLRSIHRRIARTLEDEGSAGRHVFSIARHYALGADNDVSERVYETNLRAGKVALREHAYEEAYQFLETARAHVDKVAPSERVELEHFLGEASAANGRIEEAVEHLETAIEGASPGLERARLYARLSRVRMAALEMKRAWIQVARALEELGTSLPPSGWLGRFSKLTATVERWWAARRSGAPSESEADEEARLRARLFELATIISVFRFDRIRTGTLAARAMAEAAKLPESPETARTQASFGLALALSGRREAAKRHARLAIEIAERIEDRSAIARARWFEATTCELVGEARRAEDLLRETTSEHGHWLELWERVTIFGQLAGLLLDRGYVDEVSDLGERIVEYVPDEEGSSAIVHKERAYGLYLKASVYAWRGEGMRARSYIDRAHALLDRRRDVDLVEASALGYELSVYFETGNLGEEVDELLARWEKLDLEPSRLPHQVRRFYVYQAYARLEQLRWAPEEQREVAERRLVDAIEALERAAKMPRHLTHLFVICADREFARGQVERGRALLERADEMADRADSPWGRFEVELRRARRLAQRDRRVAARRRARWAHHLAQRHGWEHRARELRNEFDLYLTDQPGGTHGSVPGPTRSASDRSTRTDSLKLERYLNSLLEVAIASGTVFDPYEQARVALDEIVRIFGAERAFLFSIDDEDRLEMLAGRDFKGRDLGDRGDYSMSVVERVRRERKPVVSTGSQEGEVLATTSAVHHNLRSIMAGPVQIQDRFLGVVYVDSRVARGIFAPDDAEILMALSSHLAIARE